MTTYVDSSVLVAVYVPEAGSAAAHRVVRRLAQIPFTPLHELEVKHAFLLLRGLELLSKAELSAVMAHRGDDLTAGRCAPVLLDLNQVFARACEVSLAHSARLLARSLDVLHVAAALELSCTRFVTADRRQAALSRAVGLKTLAIGERQRRPRAGRAGR